MTARPPDPYKALQVDPEAEAEVIAAAYRRLARKYHPDVAGDEAASRMAAINAAWEIVGDPIRRAAYDRERALREAIARSAPTTTDSTRGGASEAGRPSGTGGSGRPGGASRTGGAGQAGEPETVSRDRTSGRSSVGGGYGPSMRKADGAGAAGPPPGNPSGSVLNFGRFDGWSLGEIARVDLEFIEWLDRAPIGRQYRDEVDAILRRTGRRRSADTEATDRRGLFRRR